METPPPYVVCVPPLYYNSYDNEKPSNHSLPAHCHQIRQTESLPSGQRRLRTAVLELRSVRQHLKPDPRTLDLKAPMVGWWPRTYIQVGSLSGRAYISLSYDVLRRCSCCWLCYVAIEIRAAHRKHYLPPPLPHPRSPKPMNEKFTPLTVARHIWIP